MDNYTHSLFKIQPIYDPTRPFATPTAHSIFMIDRDAVR